MVCWVFQYNLHIQRFPGIEGGKKCTILSIVRVEKFKKPAFHIEWPRKYTFFIEKITLFAFTTEFTAELSVMCVR